MTTWTIFTCGTSCYVCRTPEEVARKEAFFKRFGLEFEKEEF